MQSTGWPEGQPAGRNDSGRLLHLLENGAPLFDCPGPVLLMDREDRIIAANPEALALVRGMMSRDCDPLLSPCRVTALTTLARATLSGGGRPQTMKIHDWDGSRDTGRTVDFTALPVDDGTHVLLFGRDISLDQNLRDALADSRQRYKDLVEISSDFAWETDAEGRFVFVSTAGALGYEPDELVGGIAGDFVTGIDGVETATPFNARESSTGIEFRFRRADGSIAELEASAAPLHDQDGIWLGARGVCRDVTAARRRDAALAKARNRERLMAYIVRAIRDELDPKAMLASAAHAIARSLAATGCMICRRGPGGGLITAAEYGAPPAAFPEGLLATDPDILPPATRDEISDPPGDTGGRGGTGFLAFPTDYHQRANGAVILWRSRDGGVWSTEDIDLMKEVAGQLGIAIEQVLAHENLERLSTTDPLTGLLNRRTFGERLDARLAMTGTPPDTGPGPGPGREKHPGGALIYIDLDDFKQINDTLGHKAGDSMLLEVAGMLRATMDGGDMAARLGGDEFVVWFNSAGRQTANAKAEQLLHDMKRYRLHAGAAGRVGMSIGIALHRPGGDAETLIARADEAMYRSKHGGKNISSFAADREYEPEDGPGDGSHGD